MVAKETILKTRLEAKYYELKAECLQDFLIYKHMASAAYAIRPDLQSIAFDVGTALLPVAALSLPKVWQAGIAHHPKWQRPDRQWPLHVAVSEGLIIAVFIAGEGYMMDTETFGIKTNYAATDLSDLLWFEMASRPFHHYEAYYINRSGNTPVLEEVEQKHFSLGDTPMRQMFKLHS